VVRAAALVLLLAVLALVASGIAWVLATDARQAGGDPDAVLAALDRPIADVDVGARYAGRAELLDPRTALPRWHAYPRAQATAVFLATRDCAAAPPRIDITDAVLAKAWTWHVRSCKAGGGSVQDLIDAPPFMHPSGRSYAALAGIGARSLHVVELASAPPAILDDDGRALSVIAPRVWEAIGRGERLVVSRDHVVLADHGAFGLARVRVFERRAFDKTARRFSLALVDREPQALCTRPASSTLCWQSVTSAEQHRGALMATTVASATAAALAALVLAVAVRRERQRAHADRLHVLRTLTHELRTPATSLGLDIEPLRAAYDDIPESCQEPLLRISDGIARLNRVLHRTARYLELFERTTKMVLHPRTVSARETFEDMREEWPEGVALDAPEEDSTITVDVEWLAVAVRNLAENAARHGKAPAAVSWNVAGGELSVRVRDAGTSPDLAIEPHRRSATSKGLGLGLAIVARVAELLGGSLSHDPSPTTFTVRVPI